MERTFNLIDEPWICVRTQAQTVREVGLRELFLEAHTFTDLAGETKTQDLAMLRLLLAIVHTVFSRYGIDGEAIDPSEDPRILIKQWRTLWNSGRFPAAPIEHYLDQWHDRFWLFDETYPFYQTKAVDGNRKEPYPLEKMIGDISESDNKKRLFKHRKSDESMVLESAEAARWLVNFICFSDKSYKGLGKKVPNRTWVSRTSLIALKGKTLFETLMLDYVAKNSYDNVPSWEQDLFSAYTMKDAFFMPIDVPEDPAGLLSLQARQVYFVAKDGKVTGYYVAGGCAFEEQEVFLETMTLWTFDKKGSKASNAKHFKPLPCAYLKQAWREFGSIVWTASDHAQSNSDHGFRAPGVIKWVHDLITARFIDPSYPLNVMIGGVVYDEGDQKSLCVTDAVFDTLSFHASFLEEIGEEWRIRVLDEIDRCDKAAIQFYYLCQELQEASGKQKSNEKTERLILDNTKSEFYARIDRPFRLWLASIDPASADPEAACAALETQLRTIALRMGKELAAQADSITVFGRYVTDKKDKKKDKLVSSASALNRYSYQISKKIFTREVKHDEQG